MNKNTAPFPLLSLLVASAILLLSPSLLAHTKLTESIPAANESLAQSPEELQLTFDDPVRLMRLTLTDNDGNKVAINYRPSEELAAEHSHPLPEPLAQGAYTLEWSAMAGDGHNMTGQFRFSVGEDTEPPRKDRQQHDHHNH